ncbi:MAG: hypothetical protein ACM3UQ_00085 [Clostridiales bacterium]
MLVESNRSLLAAVQIIACKIIGMVKLDELETPDDFKRFLHDTFMSMISELVTQETQLINTYNSNRTMPFDFYNLVIREIHTKIQCKREIYRRLTGEDLE